MNGELEVIKIVAQKLEACKIPYMFSGSIASNFYSKPRMTRDIDIVIEIKPKDVDILLETFKNDFYVDVQMVREEVARKGLFNFLHNETLVKVDFIIRKPDHYHEVELSRRRCFDIEGTKVYIVSPEDLIISKLNWAKDSFSEMQLNDVRNMLKIVKNMDLTYVSYWVNKLGLEEIFERVES